MTSSPQRGFTLLIAVLLAAVALTLSASLLDISFKQVVLASTAKQSAAAFYNTDSALECALHYDQNFNDFDYANGVTSATNIKCNDVQVINFNTSTAGNYRTTSFSVACPGGVTSNATVTIYKYNAPGTYCGSTSSSITTCIYVTGTNSCAANDPRATERGIKVLY